MNIKKLLASTFALLICCELVSTPQITDSINSIIASSEDMYSGSCGENATFSFDEATGTLTISGTGDMDSTNNWQDYAESIKSIIIEDDITSIGMYAFYNCTSLTEITIPNSIVSIGDSAFGNCTSLTEITIPDSVNHIAYAAFDNTPFIDNYPDDLIILGSVLYKYQGNDATVTIPNSITSISSCAFGYCTSLESITIPNSVTSIGDCAFEDCTSLESITIPNSVTSIGYCAFKDCTSLKEINIPNSVTLIGMCAFRNCTSLTEITIPNSVTCIGIELFRDCENLKKVTISNSVESIGEFAFGNCISLTEIIIPDSVNYIAYAAFDNTPFIDNYHDDLIILGSVLYKYQGNDAIVTIPNSVTSIGYGAFEDCTSLKEINIPNSVTSIDECAFYCCTSLKKITIPNSITWIGALSLGYNEYNYITQKRDKIEDFTIYGFKGSTAETYATENDFNFIAIDNDTQPTTKDILKLKKYILGISNDITNLDFNQDNNVNILDLNVAKQSILY